MIKYLFYTLFVGTILSTQAQTNTLPGTQLTIVQGTDSILILPEMNEITLHTAPFKLLFRTYNTDAVFVNVSYDSTAYLQVMTNQKDNMTCFNSGQSFVETVKNSDHDIYVVSYCDRGYHCLFAYDDDPRIIRFDSVQLNNPNDWLGVRTVESIFDMDDDHSETIPLSELNGKFVYVVYSPKQVNDGDTFRIKFIE